MDLTFSTERLARLCSRHTELTAWIGDDAGAIEQLLNELDCVDTLGQVERFPHIRLLPAPSSRMAVHGADEAGVLLTPELVSSKQPREAESAVIVAVAVAEEEFNPEGAAWPPAFATSRIMR